jgi:hypothetical protein
MPGYDDIGLIVLDKQMVSIKNAAFMLPAFYKGVIGRIFAAFFCVRCS